MARWNAADDRPAIWHELPVQFILAAITVASIALLAFKGNHTVTPEVAARYVEPLFIGLLTAVATLGFLAGMARPGSHG